MSSRLGAERGITILEVVTLLTVTAALVGALAPSLSETIRNARIARATTDMNAINTAIQNFLNTAGLATSCGSTAATRCFSNAGEQTEFLYSDGDVPDVGSSANWRTLTGASDKDFLEEHLVLNALASDLTTAIYGANWRGAYINAPLDPDPWGNRYAVNAINFPSGGDDVVVFSAGPDEAVDSTDNPAGASPSDDDLMVLVQS